jgi:hypothetical protein
MTSGDPRIERRRLDTPHEGSMAAMDQRPPIKTSALPVPGSGKPLRERSWLWRPVDACDTMLKVGHALRFVLRRGHGVS